jgi:hypothetical protein
MGMKRTEMDTELKHSTLSACPALSVSPQYCLCEAAHPRPQQLYHDACDKTTASIPLRHPTILAGKQVPRFTQRFFV